MENLKHLRSHVAESAAVVRRRRLPEAIERIGFLSVIHDYDVVNVQQSDRGEISERHVIIDGIISARTKTPYDDEFAHRRAPRRLITLHGIISILSAYGRHIFTTCTYTLICDTRRRTPLHPSD